MATKAPTRAQARRARQVDSEAFLRYAPQRGSLAEAISDARQRRTQTRAAATATARGVQQVARAADPQVRAVYEPTLSAAIARRGAVDTDLAGMPAAGFFKTAVSQEAQGAEGRLAGALARARGELVDRGVEAESGRAFAHRQADAEFGSTSATLRQRGFDLDSQEGAFRASRLGELEETDLAASRTARREERRADRVDARQEDSQTFQAGENAKNRAARTKKAAKGTLPGGSKPVSGKEQGELKDAVTTIRSQIKPLLTGGNGVSGLTADQVRQVFTNGRPARTRFDEKKYAELVNGGMDKVDARRQSTTKVRGIEKVDPFALRIALELESGEKRISGETIKELHRRGYGARQIGPTRSRRKRPRTPAPNPAAPGANGQLRKN